MSLGAVELFRRDVGKKVRELRQDRRWTQTELAQRLGLSQNWISEIEQGKGSLTAEQLLFLLRLFNVPIDRFLPSRGPAESQIQNALARLGAQHLVETEDTLPSDRLREAIDVIFQVLAAPQSSRHITALAPVIVHNIEYLQFLPLQGRLREVRLEHRLGWLIENTSIAIEQELKGRSPEERLRRYRKASASLALPLLALNSAKPTSEDILDPDIASKESLEEVRAERSTISRKWGIVSRIQPEDFARALRQADELS